MHIYAFGSLCRGDVSPGSDVDLLAIVEGHDLRFDPDAFSIYSYDRVAELWEEGNPFAWHLCLEARLLFASDAVNYLKGLGQPAPYTSCAQDCEKFFAVFTDACNSMRDSSVCRVFDLSMVFLSIRNIATCFSLGLCDRPDFSRHSALRIGADCIRIDANAYSVFERARILATRGYGAEIGISDFDTAIRALEDVRAWMLRLRERAREANERI